MNDQGDDITGMQPKTWGKRAEEAIVGTALMVAWRSVCDASRAGVLVAGFMSWQENHSLPWAIAHAAMTWFYVAARYFGWA